MVALDVEFVLTEWGKWSRGGGGGGLQQVITVFCLPPQISDELALRVEAAVIAAGVKNYPLRHVLIEHYQKGVGLVDLAEQMSVGRHKLDKVLSEAIGFVSGYLSNFSKAA
jgi:hypothetical protein